MLHKGHLSSQRLKSTRSTESFRVTRRVAPGKVFPRQVLAQEPGRAVASPVFPGPHLTSSCSTSCISSVMSTLTSSVMSSLCSAIFISKLVSSDSSRMELIKSGNKTCALGIHN